jgi:selenocysteine lyase/cysteine desulfurase
MISRRHFLRTSAKTAALAAMPVSLMPKNRIRPDEWPEAHQDDESFWNAVQQSFTVDRSLIHLNSGGVCPAPFTVQEAEVGHLQSFQRQPFYHLMGEAAPRVESVRARLAHHLGCDAEEVAFTRNTSEGMEIVQMGLQLEPGDEVLTTSQDYPRMLRTWKQRAARDGIRIKTIDIPVPLDDPYELVRRFEQAITPKTRLIMCCHMVDLTGQVLPVRAIADKAHAKGIPVLVDGAQTFSHLDFDLGDLDCDFFATSLHKWTLGPQGTGLLYVRRNRIADVWPLLSASSELQADIRKFEDTGTQPPARLLAVGEALAFHERIGSARKAIRLNAQRDYWLSQILGFDRVILRTNTEHAGALATVDVDGIDPVELRNHLWDRHRIRVRPIRTPHVRGIRVSAGLHNSRSELDRFLEVMNPIIRFGLPRAA